MLARIELPGPWRRLLLCMDCPAPPTPLMNSSSYLLIAVTLLALPTEIRSQGSRADYQRADALAQKTRNKVRSIEISPHWSADGKSFWYRKGDEYLAVDTTTGKRSAIFDQEVFARALSNTTGKHVQAKKLRIANLALEGEDVHIWLRGELEVWVWRPQAKTATRMPLSMSESFRLQPRNRARSSRRRGSSTEIVFINRREQAIELFWVPRSGKTQSYGKLAPGATHSQHSYAGHAWMTKDADGKRIAAFVAATSPGIAIVDEVIALPSTARKAPRSATNRPSPDGRWDVFIKDHNLYLRAVKSRKEHQLTKTGSAGNAFSAKVHWSPDSRHLVAFQTEQGDRREIQFVESSPKQSLQPKLHTYRYAKPGDKLDHPRPWLIDVTKQKAKQVDDRLFANPWSLTRHQWDADGKRFTFLFNQRGHQALRVISIDAKTGNASILIDETVPTFFDYAGKLHYQWLGSGDIIWMSERSGWNHVYRINSKTGAVKNAITHGEWVVRKIDRIDEKVGRMWLWAGGVNEGEDPYHLHYCRVDLNGKNFTVLTAGKGTHSVAFSPSREFLIDTWSRVDMPPRSVLRDARTGREICALETSDDTDLRATGWRAPEPFCAVGRDNKTDIYGVIYRPSNFDPKQQYPVIEYIYAGPHSAHVPKSFRAYRSQNRLAELGFIVVQIDGMGTSQRSKAFHDVAWKNLGDAGFPDRIAWMRAAARHEPAMDITRVGIYGGSAGGQNAMRALIAHGDFYDAAAADCGCHDNRMDKIWWNELWMSWPIGEHYVESSNVEQAHRLQGKLMLIVGELDTNVDPASTMQVVDALIKADKDFDLLVVPGGRHGAGGSAYGRRRQQDFFVRHLHGLEPRW